MYQIMLVEDEMLVRESMAQNTNWDKFGFAPPHVFENGRQALEQLESVLPDVVITDICMPFVDGLELARNIYEKFPDTIVVVLTGFSEFSYAQKAIRYHVHDYLLKPVSPKEFDQLLENLSAELSRRDNRQGLYSRAVLADEVLKDHFFQGLLQSDTAQELPEATLAAGVELGGRFHAVALAALPQRPEGFEAQGHRVAQGCAPAQLRLLGDQHVMLIVSGDETAELMARTAAGARHLRSVMQEAEITCLDYSPEMLERAKSRGEGLAHVRFQQGDVGTLPFGNSSFDIVLSLNGFHAFPDKEAAWRAIFRVLRPGGVFCGCFYVRGQNRRTDWLIRRLYVPKGWFTPPFETAESLRHRLEETFGPAKVRTVQSIASFVCRKAKEKHP